MSWMLLIVSGAMECVWAIALDKPAQFTRPVPTIIFFLALAASMFGLSHAVKDIPLGVAYAVWTAIGCILTFAYSALVAHEATNPLQVVFAIGLLACVAGLKIASA